MQSEESNTLVKLAKAVIEHAPEGGDAFWGIKFSDIEAALSAAEPLKTAFEVASKHIPEARVSLLSRAIRQGLNDYGWKNFGTLPEVLMGYIVQAERAETEAHPKQPAPSVAVKALEWEEGEGGLKGQYVWSSGDPWVFWIVKNPDNPDYVWCENFGLEGWDPCSPVRGAFPTLEEAKAAAQSDFEARIRSALSAQVQDATFSPQAPAALPDPKAEKDAIENFKSFVLKNAPHLHWSIWTDEGNDTALRKGGIDGYMHGFGSRSFGPLGIDQLITEMKRHILDSLPTKQGEEE